MKLLFIIYFIVINIIYCNADCICYTDGAVCGWSLNQRIPENNCNNMVIYQCGGSGTQAQSMGSCSKGCARPEAGGNHYCL